MLSAIAGATLVASPGDVVEIDDDSGDRLIAAGLAEAHSDKSQAKPKPKAKAKAGK